MFCVFFKVIDLIAAVLLNNQIVFIVPSLFSDVEKIVIL